MKPKQIKTVLCCLLVMYLLGKACHRKCIVFLVAIKVCISQFRIRSNEIWSTVRLACGKNVFYMHAIKKKFKMSLC